MNKFTILYCLIFVGIMGAEVASRMLKTQFGYDEISGETKNYGGFDAGTNPDGGYNGNSNADHLIGGKEMRNDADPPPPFEGDEEYVDPTSATTTIKPFDLSTDTRVNEILARKYFGFGRIFTPPPFEVEEVEYTDLTPTTTTIKPVDLSTDTVVNDILARKYFRKIFTPPLFEGEEEYIDPTSTTSTIKPFDLSTDTRVNDIFARRHFKKVSTPPPFTSDEKHTEPATDETDISKVDDYDTNKESELFIPSSTVKPFDLKNDINVNHLNTNFTLPFNFKFSTGRKSVGNGGYGIDDGLFEDDTVENEGGFVTPSPKPIDKSLKFPATTFIANDSMLLKMFAEYYPTSGPFSRKNRWIDVDSKSEMDLGIDFEKEEHFSIAGTTSKIDEVDKSDQDAEIPNSLFTDADAETKLTATDEVDFGKIENNAESFIATGKTTSTGIIGLITKLMESKNRNIQLEYHVNGSISLSTQPMTQDMMFLGVIRTPYEIPSEPSTTDSTATVPEPPMTAENIFDSLAPTISGDDVTEKPISDVTDSAEKLGEGLVANGNIEPEDTEGHDDGDEIGSGYSKR